MVLTQELLKRLFEYKNGALYWKELITNATRNVVGQKAGYIHPTGYRIISVCGKQYKAHRLMFLYHHGYIPEYIDHINNIKDDNRIENLRAATKAENCRNILLTKANSSGVKGVAKAARGDTWRARISVNGILKEKQGFKTPEEAAAFLYQWRAQEHGAFANHG